MYVFIFCCSLDLYTIKEKLGNRIKHTSGNHILLVIQNTFYDEFYSWTSTQHALRPFIDSEINH